MITQTVHENLILLDDDRRSLRKQRGFTDEIIDKYRIVSAHPDNERAISYVSTIASPDSLIAEGIMYGKKVSKQLLERGIVIPYQDATGNVVRLRRHKAGFKGKGCMVFRTLSTYSPHRTCVIAESEFKAIASEAMGVPAIGIPGISSMSGKNFEYFMSVLEDVGASRFVICFDNEVKGDPSLPNYKPDWRGRYDTIIYAYAMCLKLLDEGKPCVIAQLPDDWRVDGKADIDGALAAGHKAEEYQECIEKAMGAKAYLDKMAISKEHEPYVMRKMKSFFFKSPIHIKNNCFYFKKDKDDTKLSNCHFYIKATYEDANYTDVGLSRVVQIVDEYGIECRRSVLNSSSMTSRGSLQQWLMGQGNFLFYGKEPDVAKLWEYVFANDCGDVIYSPSRIGYIEESDMWVFGNMIIKDGERHTADEDGVCWIDNIGYKPAKINESSIQPCLAPEAGNFDIKAYAEMMSDTTDLSMVGMGKAMIGWMLANCYLTEIYERFHMFPILFLYGSRSSGKTTVMRWLSQFFGLGNAELSLSSSTVTGLSRAMGFYSNIPLVVDDWRDDKMFDKYIPFFLSVYNRQTGVKGIKKAFGTQDFEINSSLAILGEEMIRDNGVATRCLSFYMNPTRRKERYEELEAMSMYASSYTLKILENKNSDKLMTRINALLDEYAGHNTERRVLFNHVIPVASYQVLVDENDNDVLEYFRKAIGDKSKEVVLGDKIHSFAEDFQSCIQMKLFTSLHYGYQGFADEVIEIYLKGVCDVMNKFYNQHKHEPRLLFKHLSSQPYYLGAKNKRMSESLQLLPVLSFDIATMPDTLKPFFSKNNGAEYNEKDDDVPF